MDRLTGVSRARAFKGAGSQEIIAGLSHQVRDWGLPRVLCLDVAQAGRSRELKKMVRTRGIMQEFSLHTTTPRLDL